VLFWLIVIALGPGFVALYYADHVPIPAICNTTPASRPMRQRA
jgi:hypothetical protein